MRMKYAKAKNEKKRLKGYTLVEMLISIALISFVIMLVGVTLTTLIRTSIVSNVRMQARDETDIIMDVLERNIKQSDPSNILVYNSSAVRRYTNGEVETFGGDAQVTAAYGASLVPYIEGQLNGNEIHMLPYQSKRWICLGYFKDAAGNGYIVKSTSASLGAGSLHKSCFDKNQTEYVKNAITLNTEENSVTQFVLSYFMSGGDNALFTLDLSLKPRKSYGGQEQGSIDRQLVVSTQKLTKN